MRELRCFSLLEVDTCVIKILNLSIDEIFSVPASGKEERTEAPSRYAIESYIAKEVLTAEEHEESKSENESVRQLMHFQN